MIKMKNLDAKQYFTILIVIMILTDFTILLNIPILRQILGFCCFTIMPGMLILYTLKLNSTDLPKKFVLSYGLSISSMIFLGLFINSLYPLVGVSKPLSTISLVISFNVIILILCFIGYKRNKNEFSTWNGFNSKLDLNNDHLTSPLLFSIFFPLLTIFGVALMNITGNNIVLLIIPFLILIYAAFIVYFSERIHKITYPIAISMIGLALALILPLRGEYMLMGGDGGTEYNFFWLTMTNAFWDIDLSSSSGGVGCVNACLSVALLHSIFQSLLGSTPEFIYRIVTPLLLSFTPLALFILFKNHTKESYAFLAALFFASQFNFVYCINSARVLISILFFCLSIMVLFDQEIDKLNRKILFLIFTFSLILSYYSYCYMFGFIILLSWVIVSVATKFVDFRRSNIALTVVTLTLYSAVIFLWWSQITESHFTLLSNFVVDTLGSLTHAFLFESSDILAQKAMGRGLEGAPEILNLVIYYITLSLIAIGSVDSIRRWRTSKFGVEYTSLILSCLILWVIMIVATHIAEGFGIERAYYPTLIILSPCLLVGAQVICSLFSEMWINIKQMLKSPFKSDIKRPKNIYSSNDYHKSVVLIVLIVILSNLFVATGMTYQMFNDPHSVILSTKGQQYDLWYVHEQEIGAGKWLIKNRGENLVHTDAYSHNRWATIRGKETIRIANNLFDLNKQIDKGYIFLRYQNVVEGMVYTWYVRKGRTEYAPLTNYSHLFVGKSRIYDNGGSEVWR